MATMERPRPTSEKTRKKENSVGLTDAQLEARIRDLKKTFEDEDENEVENDEEKQIEIEQNIIVKEQDDKIDEAKVQEITIDSENDTNASANITVEQITEDESFVQSPNTSEDTQGALTTDTTTQMNSLTIVTNDQQSAFLYPRLSLSLWSTATAPQHLSNGQCCPAVYDPYSIENFEPSKLQHELRQTFLPFINITDNEFLNQHENFITQDPRARSSITVHNEDVGYSDDDDPDDEIYYLISSLFDIRTKIDQLTEESKILEKKIADLILHVWSFSTHQAESGAHCGDHVYLKRSIICEKANFDRNLAKAIADTQEELRKIIYQQYVALKYQTLWFKMKTDIYISTLISKTRSTKKLLHTIEVLFNFQRVHTRDDYFYKYTRQLLKQTIDIVYRYGTYDETLFIINHVLRCPAGIHNWATNFVRFLLPSNFDQLCSPTYILYTAHFLATLLFPVKNRKLFLQNWSEQHGDLFKQSLPSIPAATQQNWMLIDADGQERAARLRWDTLNEEDLIVMLNQFNLSHLMKTLFGLNNQNQPRTVSYENSLKILAILDLFVEILCRAFDTYADSQYKNFHKHISKMIRDCVHVCRYQVDEILQFLTSDDQIRLRDHYFAYIYRSVENIIRLCRNVRWSSLALFALFDLPASLQNRLLHLICSVNDKEPVTIESCAVMDPMLASSTQIEILSLLQVLHNLGRNGDETGEISSVIFYVSFVHTISRDYAMHDGRSVLVHLCSLRPPLISHILKLASVHIETVGQPLFSLFRELPMKHWTPTDADLKIIEDWIDDISSPSIEFQLGLYLIDLMNWQDLPNKQQLCIPYATHCEIAVMLLRIHLKYCDKSASTKENQLLQQTFMRNTTTNLDQWIWTAVLRLQLNSSCLTIDSFIDSMNQEQVIPAQFSGIRPISDDAMNEIRRAIDQHRNCIAQFIAFGLSQAGANAAGFFEYGIEYFTQLVQNGKYPAAIRILHDLSGIIVRSVDYLIDHVPFMNHLKLLIDASDGSASILRVASSYILQQRLYDETSNSKSLSGELLSILIWLEDKPKFRRQMLLGWFKLLTAVKEWNKDSSILFILDNLLTHSFVHDVMNEEVNNHLFKLAVSALNPQQNPQAARTGFLSWISSGSGQTYWSSLSIDSTLLPRYPMVGYYFLNAENSFEVDQNVLIEFKSELEVNPTGKADIIWKKLVQQRNFPAVTLMSLSINRWGAMASDMPVNHPLLAIVWEKFFTIYLSKHENCLHRVGHRLFESPAQTTFLKRMKSSLTRASEHYSTSSLVYASRLTSFYHALSLWIEEPRLHDPQLNVASLPQQYKDERLLDLFAMNFRLTDIKWLEFVDIKMMYDSLVKFTNGNSTGKRTVSDANELNQSFSHGKTLTSTEKLFDLVSNIQCPAKNVKINVPTVEPLIISNSITVSNDFSHMKVLFEQELKKIIDWIQKHFQSYNRQIELDRNIMSILPTLWKNESQQQSIQAFCQNPLNPVHQCTRAAYIVVKYEAKQESPVAKQRLELVSKEHSQLLSDACRSCDIELCRSIDVLDQIISFLTPQVSSKFRDNDDILTIITVGTEIFYNLLTVYDDRYKEIMEPISERLSSFLDRLGELFIRANLRQPLVILEYILSNGLNIPRLINFFNPNTTDQSEKFIDIYQRLSKMTSFSEYLPFILPMFRKFNVLQWFKSMEKPSSHLKFVDVLFNHFCALVENYPKLIKVKNPSNEQKDSIFEQLNELFDISIGHMIQILNYSYPSQVGCLFFHLVELIQSMRKRQRLVQQQNKNLTPLEFQQSIEFGLLPGKILTEFLEQIKHMEKSSETTLSKQQIKDLLDWLYDFVMQQTIDTGEDRLLQLYRSWRPCLNELSRIYSEMTILIIRKSLNQNEMNVTEIFNKTRLAFGVFIDPSSGLFMLNEWKKIVDHQGDMLTRLIKMFVQLNKEFFEYINESSQHEQEFLNCLFKCWSNVVRSLISDEYTHPIIDIYHREMRKIPWENFRLTIESILIFDELIEKNDKEKIGSSSLYEFIVFLLSSIDVRNWNSRNDENISSSLVPIYFRVLIKIFTSQQTKFIENNETLSRLSSQSENIPWKFVTATFYNETIDEVLSKLNENFILAVRASVDGYLNRILRNAAEFSDSSINVDRIRSKRLIYVQLFEQNLINSKEKHNTDEYRLALINFLNEIELLSNQGKISIDNELENIFNEFFRFLNISSLGQTVLTSYQTILLDWIRQSQSSSVMTAIFASVSRTIKDFHRKILFTEILLTIFFSNTNKDGWKILFEIFSRSEDFSQFKLFDRISLCCELKSILTIYLYSKFEEISLKNSSNEEILKIENRIFQKLVEFFLSLKMEFFQVEEEKSILLLGRIVELLDRQIQFGKSDDVFLVRSTRNLANFLLVLSSENKENLYNGIFSLIGLGKKIQFSFRFRLAVRMIGTMFFLQIIDEPEKFRVDQNEFQVDPMAPNNENLKQSIATLSKIIVTANDENQFRNELIHCQSQFLQNPTATFLNVKNLFEFISERIFADSNFLKNLH